MARARNIKPGFFTNDELAEVDPLGRILFAGLWTIADRQGRLEDRPKKIKAEILPYDNCEIDSLLQDLNERGFIFRYLVNGVGYIQIVNWSKHQNPHIKESASIIPAPCKHSADTILVHDNESASVNVPKEKPSKINGSDQHHTSTVQAPEKHSSSPADSLNLIPDSLNPITLTLNQSSSTIPVVDDDQEKIIAEVFSVYQNEIGIMSDIIQDKLLDLIKHYPRDWIINAIKIAVLNGARKLNYVEGVINRWRSSGYDTKTKPWEDDENGRNRNKSRSFGRGQPSHGSAKKVETDWDNEPDILG